MAGLSGIITSVKQILFRLHVFFNVSLYVSLWSVKAGSDMLEINIPNKGLLNLQYLVLDVNGTIAVDGVLVSDISPHIEVLREMIDMYLVTADTHGTLGALNTELNLQYYHLQPGNEPEQKAAFVEKLGAEHVVAVGNGANDAKMLHVAKLGIAVIGGEGLATSCLWAADIVVPDIQTAFDLLIKPRRLIATLRS